jgi:hypothetical protein
MASPARSFLAIERDTDPPRRAVEESHTTHENQGNEASQGSLTCELHGQGLRLEELCNKIEATLRVAATKPARKWLAWRVLRRFEGHHGK